MSEVWIMNAEELIIGEIYWTIEDRKVILIEQSVYGFKVRPVGCAGERYVKELFTKKRFDNQLIEVKS